MRVNTPGCELDQTTAYELSFFNRQQNKDAVTRCWLSKLTKIKPGDGVVLKLKLERGCLILDSQVQNHRNGTSLLPCPLLALRDPYVL